MNRQENKKDRKISLKVDYAFKKVFGDERHTDALKYLLHTILGYDKDTFEELSIQNTEQTRNYYASKESRLDILAKLKSGELINIEMQVDNIQSNAKRFLYYWATVYDRQLKLGEPYENLRKTISINLLDYELDNSKKLHSVYHITEDETGERYTDILEIHNIELPKLKNISTLEKVDKNFISLMKFISAESKEEMKMIAKYVEELDEVLNIMNSLEEDDDTWYAYLSREKFLRDQISKEHYYTNKGIAIGEIRGMLTLGADIAKISELTGATEEEILQVKRNM